ncbi:T9SS type A sorting domain-containing protein [Neolewinella antarctica]|uniref:Secretion system C-terminal sorting domain-containing protein n=1 Tax=Neolewinella antarctica TaxID=442734 RepID=A0ABX0XEQ4_9BACT|nr:T9SS type A sorting domain-containing protein [Neolewinella antarctica]NJC27590.1 hypothetical protein [Neolewinella antarctica]
MSNCTLDDGVVTLPPSNIPIKADSVGPSLFTPGNQWNLFSMSGGVNSPAFGYTTRYRLEQLTQPDSIAFYRIVTSRDSVGEDNFLDSGDRLEDRTGKVYFQPAGSTQDYLLYDFTAMVGDTLEFIPVRSDFSDGLPYKLLLTDTDTIELANGERRKRWEVSCLGEDLAVDDNFGPWYYIEGIGYQSGLFNRINAPCEIIIEGWGELLNCFSANGETLYRGSSLRNECFFNIEEPDEQPSSFSPYSVWNQFVPTGEVNEGYPGYTLRYLMSPENTSGFGNYTYELETTEEEGADISSFTKNEIRINDYKGVTFYQPFKDGPEYLLYDFTAEVGDTLNYRAVRYDNGQDKFASYQLIVTATDSVTLTDGTRRRRWFTACLNSTDDAGQPAPFMTYVEQMGSTKGLLYPLEVPGCPTEIETERLLCYYYNQVPQYENLSDLLPSCFVKRTVATGGDQLARPRQMTVYPNPTNGNVTVTGVELASARLFDAAGELVHSYGRGNEINTGDVPPGLYFLRGLDERGNTFMMRLVVSR